MYNIELSIITQNNQAITQHGCDHVFTTDEIMLSFYFSSSQLTSWHLTVSVVIMVSNGILCWDQRHKYNHLCGITCIHVIRSEHWSLISVTNTIRCIHAMTLHAKSWEKMNTEKSFTVLSCILRSLSTDRRLTHVLTRWDLHGCHQGMCGGAQSSLF